MDKLPTEITRKIYEYDSTYKELFDKTLKQLRCYCFIYRCSQCLSPITVVFVTVLIVELIYDFVSKSIFPRMIWKRTN